MSRPHCAPGAAQSQSPTTSPVSAALRRSRIALSELAFGERIGAGQFGEVFRAEYLGSEVAVKLIAYATDGTQSMDGFAQEVALMTKLHHPNVVMIMGVVAEALPNGDRTVQIVTELMGKGSLRDIIDSEEWNASTCFNAAENGHLAVLQWARAQGCPWG